VNGLHRPRASWLAIALSPFVILLLVLSATPIVVSVTPVYGTPTKSMPSAPSYGSVGLDSGIHAAGLFPQAIECTLYFVTLGFSAFGPGCLSSGTGIPGVPAGLSEAVAAKNIVTTLANYLNITAAEVANLNATMQETLSYFEARAESIVPYFLNQSWSQNVSDSIAIDSGLIPAIIGMETALSHQQYEDWNATAASWDAAFGAGGAYAADSAAFEMNHSDVHGDWNFVALNGEDFTVSQPWEYWTPYADGALGGSNITYFNLQPGGTIVQANIFNDTFPTYSTLTVYDLSKGTHFAVPDVTYNNWATDTVPVETTVQSIGQFDLLKLVCTGGCLSGDYPVEVSNGYAFLNRSTTNPGTTYQNTMVQLLSLINSPYYTTFVPTSVTGACVAFSPSGIVGNCGTYTAPSEGNTSVVSTGPGTTVGGTTVLTGYASTMQGLVNNSMTMAYDYWLTLRAITKNGTYTIPPDCAIPTPSDAFSPATNFATYGLSANNVEGVYLAYLNSVALLYGGSFTSGTFFCGSPNLGITANWHADYNIKLNITASLFAANSSFPLFLNGTKDTKAVYANEATWPVVGAVPTLLYPFDYTLQVPVGKVYPIPANDPVVAVLLGLTVPTYNSLYGNGNLTFPSGVLSSTRSGYPVSQGDAIYISSCVLNNVSESTCVISDTYFANFSVGHVAAIVPPPPPGCGPGGCGGGLGGNACGTGGFNSWYDAWAGYVVSGVASLFIYIGNALASAPFIGGALQSFFTALGCVLGWVVLILVLVLIAWLVVKLVSWFRGRNG
jgi:hypothetical protein